MKRPRQAARWSTLALALAPASVFPGATSARSADALPVSKTFYATVGLVDCAPTEPPGSRCFIAATRQAVQGLGEVEFQAQLVVLDPTGSCPGGKLTASLLTGRGTLALAGNSKGCINQRFGYGDYDAAITGTGAFAGASGTATVAHQNNDNWVVTGTVNAPDGTFDLTPPKLVGLADRAVKAAKGKRATKVRFAVTATDAVDGVVPVTCKPPSGTAFRVGRTRVTCTATDRSGNTATGSFTVTVR